MTTYMVGRPQDTPPTDAPGVTWGQAQEALWFAEMTTPKHYVDAAGEIRETTRDFVVFAKTAEGWVITEKEIVDEPSVVTE